MKVDHCTSCGVILVVSVNWTAAQQAKSTYKCNTCRAEYQRKYHLLNRKERLAAQREHYETNKEHILAKQKEYYIEKTFGLSLEDYADYMERSCKICGKNEDKVLDHCHTTGKVRDTLCRQCNMALGLFKDNRELIKRAEEYLLEHTKSH